MEPTGNPEIDQQIEILKTKLVIPKRENPKAGGQRGRHTEVEVNHLPLDLDEFFKKTIYLINCKFTPEYPKRLLRPAMEQFVERHYQNVYFAFDGIKYMYTTVELKEISDTVRILNEETGNSIDFIISISVHKIDNYFKNGSSNYLPGEILQALDIILKSRPFSLRFTNAGRSFYPIQHIPVDLGGGIELWKGFFQSHVMGWKSFLNIDLTHKAFPLHQPLTSYIENELHRGLNTELDYRSRNTLANYVKGLKIDFMIPNQPNTKRSFKVIGLLENASKFMFEFDYDNQSTSSRMTTVYEYFKKTRLYTIKYPNLPCLNVGKVDRITALPIELCTVQKGQIKLIKLTDNQTARMVRSATRPPAERRQKIENFIEDIKYNNDLVLKEFGINIHEKFDRVLARVLDEPYLAYYHNREIKPIGGVWKPDKFFKPAKLTRWVVYNLDMHTRLSEIKHFEQMLMQNSRELNMLVSSMVQVYNYSTRRNADIDDIQEEITNFLKKMRSVQPPIEIVVVIMPDFPNGVYELEIGMLTQCIKSKTMKKMNSSTANNIMLKINLKLNGINHTLSPRSCPSTVKDAIIFGADVTHPSPDQTSIPSIAALAASHDLYGSQYNMECRLQSPKVEIIQDLEDMVHKQLLKYIDKTNKLPIAIFYLRDGVGEGQFAHLLHYELIAIRRACLRLSIKYQPSLTFVVVQKRHHTRMFPKHKIDMHGKFQNVPPGTVIDTQITHTEELDFYLCSHASIQGTSKPTKYHLIWDDNDCTEDELEEVIYYLCYMFARCTRSISYPAPTYYAHLAAFRARSYIENKKINLNRLDEEQKKIKLNELFTTESPMHFV
ncbi:Argonaute linker 2 domain,Ribonuclease H-like domain,PAZ domain,Piwi domain,Argonaute, linker 1 [Cinara cedri]|uniref:Argonaute linker 2 domain,Ribonuclease H-like domain,PAZ domain,Piwi domain,Argonaute, linker 1 n=1 Tax=Cinara cedri TaxID=506608 RepID=A0A5E4N4C0_9HEMI|nr:Argonaute linker 2 domain,Ribonuclease H-like domain,PAZ domain,Piwi domain,Argonaute, linker 1 [Cinara cedri]